VQPVSSSVPAVISAVRIIERLAGEWPSGVATSVLVTDLEMNRSTCYNILATLQESGWVTNLGSRAGWRLGSRLFALGGGQDQHLRFVQSVIEDLSQELGFVVFVAERLGSGGYGVIAKAERRSGVRVTAAVGDQFTFSAPALMQAFEAWTPTEEFDRLATEHGVTSFTEFTVTDLEQLHDRLAEVRRQGYSRSVREYNLAQGGVAAPIFDARGRTTLVLCALGFSTDLYEENVDAVGARLREAADRITERLGGRTPRRAS
jgi:DNA-binding IclR family transcriptional regulator